MMLAGIGQRRYRVGKQHAARQKTAAFADTCITRTKHARNPPHHPEFNDTCNKKTLLSRPHDMHKLH